ncbi:PHP domain-containing protein [uncultured Clostridium sp.]|uniref:PHP domain-containing protein n=1 Tax=uncultured Clostridium sp. TaxID=59620 RepID=UPI0025F1AACE|nr:PHP domain-containing protein [uncultured Clostridium sp.]
MFSIGLDKKEYVNYHKHTMYSNLKALDCVVKPRDYMERMVELNHKTYVTTEHGNMGNVYEAYTLCGEYKFNMVVAVEAYFVKDRFEKDRSNYHLVIIAKNDVGRKQINKIMSEANITGYYYKPRIDEELLLSLNPDDVMITTACTGGILRMDDIEEYLLKLKEHFKNNLYIETQCHSHESQVDHNKLALKLSKKLNIPLIHANDSHYILPEDSKYRDAFLRGKGIRYPEEDGFILDYPSYDTIVKRYKEQGVLSEDEIYESLENTLVINDFRCHFDKDIKLPKISENPNKKLKEIIKNKWNQVKVNIPKSRHKEYIEAIKYEMDIIEKTGMEEYFVLDYEIIKRSQDVYDGVITRTGRGSAPSFFITNLLELTNLDRLDSPITLYPTRFMSVERILGTKSLPDIDINASDREPLIKASKDILGEDGVHWLISYKPLQDSSAFRLWCKSQNMSIDDYNDIAKDIDNYRDDSYWGPIIEESKVFVGVVESVAPSPCSFLLLDKPISEEVGLMKVGDEICCCLDGYNCDFYKYLKNDYLAVTVWKIIEDTCKLAGIDIPTIKELDALLDEQTFKMYELGLTATLNQADSQFATEFLKRYKPKTLGEMSAFVASIRPGFASLVENFIDRKPYTTGVEALDEILKDSYHYLMYQESIMKYLVWLGIPESQTYDIIKKIAKKKFKEDELIQLKAKLFLNWLKVVGEEKGFDETWQVIEDASKYSFNASHSLSYAYDSLYGAYLKSHYPLEYYTVSLNIYQGDMDKTTRLLSEFEYFGIKLEGAKFGKSKGEYFLDKEENVIYKGIGSLKYLNSNIGNELYEISKEKKYSNFIEVLERLSETKLNSRQLEILIKIGYFSEYGKSAKLMRMYKEFDAYYNRKTYSKKNFENHDLLRKYAGVETKAMFKELDKIGFLKEYSESFEDEELSFSERIKAEIEYMGTPISTDSNYPKNVFAVKEINVKYSPVLTIYRACDGRQAVVKTDKKLINEFSLEPGDMIRVTSTNKKPKKKVIDGKWQETGEFNTFISYQMLEE